MAKDMQAYIKEAAAVKPSARQMAWFDTEFYGFVHFGVNTYTGREWGDGSEDPAIFDPVDLDCDQWVTAFQSAGMGGMVVTAKHHDGFCLWPSRHTEHSVKSSPWRNGQGDVVREAAEACRRGGLKFGFYLSPWDRNSSLYGTDAYNDYYKAQLTELLTGYGDIFMVWFDGACGEGPNGRKQEYDFPGYIELVRKYQPGACIFYDHGPDVRWVGNESGTARFAEWAVVPSELATYAEVQTGQGPLPGSLDFMYNTMPDIGALSNILYSRGLCFCPSEVDMSIRPGWFYHPEEEPHSLERLLKTYATSVGGNACLHLNVPPMPSGRLDDRDVARLAEMGDFLRTTFGKNLVKEVAADAPEGETQATYAITLEGLSEIKAVVLREDLAQGQRVESFALYFQDEHGQWRLVHQNTIIGNKRICPLSCKAQKLKLLITAARDTVQMRSIEVY